MEQRFQNNCTRNSGDADNYSAKNSIDAHATINTEVLQQIATSSLQSCDGITNLDNLISDTTGIGNSDTQRLSNKPAPSSRFDGLAYILGNLISKYSGVLDEPLHLSFVN